MVTFDRHDDMGNGSGGDGSDLFTKCLNKTLEKQVNSVLLIV